MKKLKYHYQINIIDFYNAMCEILEKVSKEETISEKKYNIPIFGDLLDEILNDGSIETNLAYLDLSKDVEEVKIDAIYTIIKKTIIYLSTKDIENLEAELNENIELHKIFLSDITIHEIEEMNSRSIKYVSTSNKEGILSIEKAIHKEEFEPFQF